MTTFRAQRRLARAAAFLPVVLVILPGSGRPCLAGQIRPDWHTPGPTQGETVSRWIAPHVRELSEGTLSESHADSGCCRPGRAAIRWYGADGQVEFELAGEGVQPCQGYVTQSTDTSEIYYGLAPRWSMVLPEKRGSYSTIAASPTGDLFIHKFHPDSGHVALDVYRDGRRERMLGPYPSKPGGTPLHIEPWGSMAMVTGVDRDQDTITVLLYGRDGEFLVSVPGTTLAACPSPSGRRAALQSPGQLLIVHADGHLVEIADPPSSRVALWGPDEADLLVTTSGGDVRTCAVIDATTGSVRWELPVEGTIFGDGPAVLLGDLLLIATTEQRDTRYCYRVRALDWKTGRPVADWGGDTWTSERRGRSRLMTVGDQFYYVDDRRFARLDAGDIREQRFGWTLVGP